MTSEGAHKFSPKVREEVVAILQAFREGRK
jgi:hypothetical protein